MKSTKKFSLINGLLFIFIGLFIFIKPDAVIKFISYFIGGLLLAIGIYKVVNYYIQDKRLGIVNTNELAFGISAVVLGLLFIFLAGTIELMLRIIIGVWLIFAGIARISNTFYTTTRDSKFYALLVVGLILIVTGLYVILVSNLVISTIGLIMAIYGLIDLVSYFIYKDSFIDNMTNNSNKKEIEVKEAEVHEKEEDK